MLERQELMERRRGMGKSWQTWENLCIALYCCCITGYSTVYFSLQYSVENNAVVVSKYKSGRRAAAELVFAGRELVARNCTLHCTLHCSTLNCTGIYQTILHCTVPGGCTLMNRCAVHAPHSTTLDCTALQKQCRARRGTGYSLEERWPGGGGGGTYLTLQGTVHPSTRIVFTALLYILQCCTDLCCTTCTC